MSDTVQLHSIPENWRWKAIVTYEVDGGEFRQNEHYIEELYEIHDIIEQGPTWCSIRDFRIEYHGPKETIKESIDK